MVHRHPNNELLDNVATEVVVCIKCGLSNSRKKAVPGIGDPEVKILLIGEAPGASEDIQGEPFVGSAGKFLDELLAEAGLKRRQVFITNIVKCRPPENRDPTTVEIETCTPYLNRQIFILEPKFIVTLGKHSTAYIFSKANIPFNSITKAHGKTYEISIRGLEMTVFPTFHPAAALYNASYRDDLLKDFRQLGKEIQKRGILSP